MEITVKTINGTDFKMNTTAQTSIMQLRQEIGRKLAVQSDRVRLIFNGRVLNNADTVDKYNIVDCSIIHCVIRPEQTPSSAPSAASASSVSATVSRSSGTPVSATPTASGSTHRSSASSSSSTSASSSSSSRPNASGSGSSGGSSSRGSSALPQSTVAVMGLGTGGPSGGFFTMGPIGSGPPLPIGPGFESMISGLFGGMPVQQSMQISSAGSSTQPTTTAQERLIAQAVSNVVDNALFGRGLQSAGGTTTVTTGTTTATTSTSTTAANANNNTVPTAATATTATPAGGAGRVPSSTTSTATPAAAPATPVQLPSQTNGTPSNNMQWPRPGGGGSYYNMGMSYGMPSPYGSSPMGSMYPGVQFNQAPGMIPFAYQQMPMMVAHAPLSSPYGMNVNMPQQVVVFIQTLSSSYTGINAC